MDEQGENWLCADTLRTPPWGRLGDACSNTWVRSPNTWTIRTSHHFVPHQHSRLVHHVITDNPRTPPPSRSQRQPTTITILIASYLCHQSLKWHNSTSFSILSLIYFFLSLVCHVIIFWFLFLDFDFILCPDSLDKEKPAFRHQPVEVILVFVN